jgi:hypothetical protein
MVLLAVRLAIVVATFGNWAALLILKIMGCIK